MSNDTTIGLIKKDGSVDYIHCYNDGALQYAGETLYLDYKDVSKINELISLGQLSSLAKEISPLPNVVHNWNNSVEDVCVFYGRDRNEKGQEKNTVANFKNFIENLYEGDTPYNYFYKESDDLWYVFDIKTSQIEELSVALSKSKNVSQETKNEIEYQIKLKEVVSMVDNLEQSLLPSVSITKQKIKL